MILPHLQIELAITDRTNYLTPLREIKSIENLSSLSDPRIIRASKIHDANGDKIADSLSKLITEEVRSAFDLPDALRDGGKKVEVMICVDQKPNLALEENQK